jgi:hypothetical protein
MRLTDDRYHQERIRLELGLRLLRHEAKNCTIRHCTGISEDRVRKLFKTYIEGQTPQPLRRKRGKSPQELSLLLRNDGARLEASILAGAMHAVGIVPMMPLGKEWSPSTHMAARCCDAYEHYLQLFDSPRFTFEHAWFLLLTLARTTDLILTECTACSASILQDRCAQPKLCPFCHVRPPLPPAIRLHH